jgi:hypothetical protein
LAARSWNMSEALMFESSDKGHGIEGSSGT